MFKRTKKSTVMTEGPYATYPYAMYCAQFLESDTISLSSMFKYFSVDKYVMKRTCQNSC